jgi:protein-disulfide isomerase
VRFFVSLLLLLATSSFAQRLSAQTTSPGSPAGASEDRTLLQTAVEHRSIGSDSTAVVVYLFTDFACPDCAIFVAEQLDPLIRAVVAPGTARVVHASFLIPRLLRGWNGASAAYCIAGLTDAKTFDEAARRIFAEQGRWATARDPLPVLRTVARDVGTDMERFDDCVSRNVMAPLLLSDVRAGFAAGVTGTPTIVVVSAKALRDRTRDPFAQAETVQGSAGVQAIVAAVQRVAKRR